jgi:hypothetical protein
MLQVFQDFVPTSLPPRPEIVTFLQCSERLW